MKSSSLEPASTFLTRILAGYSALSVNLTGFTRLLIRVIITVLFNLTSLNHLKGATTMKNSVNFLSLFLILFVSYSASAQTCPGSPGCLDPTFGSGGTQVVSLVGSSTITNDLVVQSDGKVVSLHHNFATHTTLIRLNTDGSPDSSFGNGGIVNTNWYLSGSLPNGQPEGLAIQTVAGEERLVVAGWWNIPSGKRSITMLRLDRYLSNGQPDTSFGTNGTVIVKKGPAYAVAIQPADNKIVTIGDLGAVVRFHADGAVDTSFGSKGDGTSATNIDAASVKILPDGRLLFGGSYVSRKTTSMAVAILRSDGAVDTTFGNNGMAVANFYGNGTLQRGYRVDLDPYGNIIIGGFARPGSGINSNFAAARFTPNGQLDTSFNGTGMVTHDFGGLDDFGHSIVAQSDGKLVITGWVLRPDNIRDFGLVRFHVDGSLDTLFGSNGHVTTSFGAVAASYASRIWTDPLCGCEKIIMAGMIPDGATFARYLR